MSGQGQFRLLGEKRFGPFFWTQALGAFNDNVFKNALVILMIYQGAQLAGLSSQELVIVAQGLFILPFFLFSATFGQLADKYEKSRLIRITKVLEIAIMLGGALAFWLGEPALLLGVLFFMGFQSSLFGPAKYGILPQHLRPDELVGGNGLIEMATFLAILLGTLLGGVLIGIPGFGWIAVSVVVVLLAIAGYATSRGIPLAPATAPDLHINWNPVTETWRNLANMRTNRTVFLSVLGISWFWFYGGTFLQVLPGFTKDYLGGSENVATLVLTLFSLGIGVGSLLCERLSGRQVEIGLVPFGAIGLTLFALDLYFMRALPSPVQDLGVMAFLQTPGAWRVVIDLLLIGLFGGFFIVPLYALVQSRSEPERRSRVIAGNNILNAAFMVASALLSIVLLKAGFSIPELLMVTAVLNALVAIYIFTLVPEFLLRFLTWLLINTLYRVRTEGLAQIPDEGPVLLVSNHVSFVDALLIGGSVRRPARFVMYYKLYNLPVLRFFFKVARVIPIAGAKEDPELLEKAFAEIKAALDAGDVVGIFPEGGITRDGEIQPFRSGVERILAASPVPVVPMALRGLWGSVFSRRDAAMRRLRRPRRFWSRVGIVAGPALPPGEASAAVLESRVRELRGELR